MSKEKRPAEGATTPVQMRLGEQTLADLDLIALHHAGETGLELSRTDAVRIAARREADRIRRLMAKS